MVQFMNAPAIALVIMRVRIIVSMIVQEIKNIISTQLELNNVPIVQLIQLVSYIKWRNSMVPFSITSVY